MRYQYIIALALIFVLAVSGCVEGMPDVFKQMMGQKVEGEVKEALADIITVQNTNIIPTPPIYADGEFTVSFEVFNQDETKEVENVGISLYDYGMCAPQKDQFSPSGWTEVSGAYSYSFGSFVPQQTEFAEFKFEAPSNTQIGGMEAECPIRYKVNYDFNAISQTDIQVISEDKLKALQRAGQSPSFTPTQSIGRGPIKIYFDFGAPLPIRENSILPVFIWIEDKGSGIFGDIKEKDDDQIWLKVPKDLVPDDFDGCNGKFDKTPIVIDETINPEYKNYNVYKLASEANIPMVKKKSPQLRCSFKPTLVTDEKTYYISANMSYSYALYEDLSVAIKPTLVK